MIKDKMNYLFQLCMEVQSGKDGKIERRQGKEAKLKSSIGPTVFFDFSGHVSKVEIHIHKHGWVRNSDSDETFSFYADRELDEQKFEKCRDCLLELIKERKQEDK